MRKIVPYFITCWKLLFIISYLIHISLIISFEGAQKEDDRDMYVVDSGQNSSNIFVIASSPFFSHMPHYGVMKVKPNVQCTIHYVCLASRLN